MSGGFAPSAGSRLRLAFVRGLTLQALLGVHPREKATLQRAVVGVELAVEDDAAPTGVKPDELRRVVDYEGVVRAARAEASGGHTLLVETLAERIALAGIVNLAGCKARATARQYGSELHAAIWTQVSCRHTRKALARARRYWAALIR
jgi:dihydroneopterin aldolase